MAKEVVSISEHRTRYTPEFKAEVVLRALRANESLKGLAKEYGISPVMLSRWKSEFVERAPSLFTRATRKSHMEALKRDARIQELESAMPGR